MRRLAKHEHQRIVNLHYIRSRDRRHASLAWLRAEYSACAQVAAAALGDRQPSEVGIRAEVCSSRDMLSAAGRARGGSGVAQGLGACRWVGPGGLGWVTSGGDLRAVACRSESLWLDRWDGLGVFDGTCVLCCCSGASSVYESRAMMLRRCGVRRTTTPGPAKAYLFPVCLETWISALRMGPARPESLGL